MDYDNDGWFGNGKADEAEIVAGPFVFGWCGHDYVPEIYAPTFIPEPPKPVLSKLEIGVLAKH